MTLHYVSTTAYNVRNNYRFLKSKFAYNGNCLLHKWNSCPGNYSKEETVQVIHGKTVGVSQKADLLYHSLNQNLTKLCSQIQMQQFSSKFNTNNLQQNSTQQYRHLEFSCKLYNCNSRDFLENIDMYIVHKNSISVKYFWGVWLKP